MGKLGDYIFEAITQLRCNKNRLNESTKMTRSSEKLEELNLDKKRLTERLHWLAEYKKLENKPFNGVTSYYNMSDDTHRTEPSLAPNSLDTTTPDKCHHKELEMTIIY